jgi:redox-sensitive bicupin YhaK (pirin superfamily)
MIKTLIPAREAALVGDLKVRRILPFRTHRRVGPFVFLDHMGPIDIRPGDGGDVAPHPHIGLSTVTYLFEGELLHRDSLGSLQPIVPGDLNWMTAGKGIVHSERMPTEVRIRGGRMHGMQAWVALPVENEDDEPTFEHYNANTLPRFEVDGVKYSLIAGSAFGHVSPVRTHSPLFYVAADAPAGKRIRFDPGQMEAAVYVVAGQVTSEGQTQNGPGMLVFDPGEPFEIQALTDAKVMLLGGSPLEGPRHIFWNFVSSSREKIEQAKLLWHEQKFPKVPGETEFVPLPEGAFRIQR